MPIGSMAHNFWDLGYSDPQKLIFPISVLRLVCKKIAKTMEKDYSKIREMLCYFNRWPYSMMPSMACHPILLPCSAPCVVDQVWIMAL